MDLEQKFNDFIDSLSASERTKVVSLMQEFIDSTEEEEGPPNGGMRAYVAWRAKGEKGRR
jgi:hypothetical protein